MAVTDNMAVDNIGAANDAALSPLTAQGFANAAAASDKFEIETSQLAATNASSAAVKKFATQMIAAHSASTAKLKSTLAGQSPAITPDDTLNPEQQSRSTASRARPAPRSTAPMPPPRSMPTPRRSTR